MDWSEYTCFVTEDRSESEENAAVQGETPTTEIAREAAGAEVTAPGNGQRAPALRLVAAALMLRGDEVLICQRRPDQPMALQWEFPGGKIEAGESAEQALARGLSEEVGVEGGSGPR